MYNASAVEFRALVGRLALLLAAGIPAFTQLDPVQQASKAVTEATSDQIRITFEERTRWEERTGVNFGSAADQQDGLTRIRIGAQYEPTEWLKFSGMGQDARAPFFGVPAPNTYRDTMDLHEAYVELYGHRKTGFGATFGRQMVNYGEARLIGVPQ